MHNSPMNILWQFNMISKFGIQVKEKVFFSGGKYNEKNRSGNRICSFNEEGSI